MRTRLASVVIGAGLLTGVLAIAGPLSPPPGPVAPTEPSLADIHAAVGAARDTHSTPGSATDGRPLPAPGEARVVFADESPVSGAWRIADLAGSVQVVEYREGTSNGATIPLPGFTQLPAVTLIRPLSPDRSAAAWFETVAGGDVASARADASLVLLDESGTPAALWLLVQCWPHAYDIRVDGPEASEQLTITMESLHRIQ